MIDLIKQYEDVPASYPAVPSGLSVAAAALNTDVIWAKIESYIAHQFTAREVVWTLIGDGGDQFHPRLTPVVSSVADVWNEQWETLTLQNGPLGQCLPYDGTFRITAQVGAGPVPAAVSQAFVRLAEYSAKTDDHPGASAFSTNVGPLNIDETRNPNWMARAIINSGAGDLLRPFRRA